MLKWFKIVRIPFIVCKTLFMFYYKHDRNERGTVSVVLRHSDL